jgi:hypothetical protein
MTQRNFDFDKPRPKPRPEPLPPHCGVDTSIAAADSVAEHTPNLRAIVLQAIVAKGTHGATRDELAAELGYIINTILPRVWELMKAGRIKETEQRRLTRSGRMARLLVAVSVLPTAYHNSTGIMP